VLQDVELFEREQFMHTYRSFAVAAALILAGVAGLGAWVVTAMRIAAPIGARTNHPLLTERKSDCFLYKTDEEFDWVQRHVTAPNLRYRASQPLILGSCDLR
jgi:hypothetical protein